MKKVLFAAAFILVGLVACENAADSKEKDSATTEETKVDESKIVEMEEVSTKLEEAKKESDKTAAELDSLVENL